MKNYIISKAKTEEEKEAIRDYHRKWRAEHPGYGAAAMRRFYWKDPVKNREYIRNWAKAWRRDPKNAEAYRKQIDAINQHSRSHKTGDPVHQAKCRAYYRKKMQEDPQFGLRKLLRARLREALVAANATKHCSAIELVGCPIPDLKLHLERQFLPGMAWDKENRKKWHIDHIIPLDAYDLRDPEQQKLAFHFINLRPLWGPDNLSKGSKRLYLL